MAVRGASSPQGASPPQNASPRGPHAASAGAGAGKLHDPGGLRPRRVSVLLPLPFDRPLDYLVPPDLDVEAGSVVEVPLGPRRLFGVVWDAVPDMRVAAARLKPITRVLPVPPMRNGMRKLVDWVAAYTLSPPGAVMRMGLSVPAALEPPRAVAAFRLADPFPETGLTAARERVKTLLEDGLARSGMDIAREAGVSSGVVRGMLGAGLLEAVMLPARPPPAVPDPYRPRAALTAVQAAAAARLAEAVTARRYSATLVDGVTGAGKTEVYFEAIAATLREGRQALVLLPEIALTAQWLDRFARRFGTPPVQWHSDLGATTRRAAWRFVAEGAARVVVGARSALFLPFPDLGLIVVDEEHEQAFKQEEGVAYHARDIAVVRAWIEDFPVVLASATPSLETVANVERGRYGAVHLPQRHAGASLPAVRLVDLRRDSPPRGRWLAPSLVQSVGEAIAAGDQAMLFLNRRGYAPLTLCRHCGHRFQCPNCTAWLVEHRFHARLQCHHCGHAVPKPHECPACGHEDSLVPCGPGVERVAEEAALLWPDARVAVATSDTLAGPLAIAELVRRVLAHEVDLLIGTQVLAKGHHFPQLTVVGVIDADLGLSGGDLRAGERTFQLLSQVAGRAGRAEKPGRVLLQTWESQHPVLQALAKGDRDRFLQLEADERRRAGMPPYGRLAALILSGTDLRTVETAAGLLARCAPQGADLRVFGPAPAPLALLRGQHRMRLLLKAGREVDVPGVLRHWLGCVELPRGVRVQVDVDPYSFL